jgi:hypothetical protein
MLDCGNSRNSWLALALTVPPPPVVHVHGARLGTAHGAAAGFAQQQRQAEREISPAASLHGDDYAMEVMGEEEATSTLQC